MKKAIALVILLTSAMVFSCGVFATTSKVTVHNAVNNTYTNNGLSMRVNVAQLYPYTDAYDHIQENGWTGSMSQHNNEQIVITIRIVNNTSVNKYINGVVVAPQFNDSDLPTGANLAFYTRIHSIENLGPDFGLGIDSTNGNFYGVFSGEWTYNQYLCIPANTTLSCVTLITIPCTYESTANGSSWQDGIPMDVELNSVSISPFTATDTTYIPSGAGNASIANDVDDIDTVINNLYTLISNNLIPINTNVADIESIANDIQDVVDDIYNELHWNGTYTVQSFGSFQAESITTNDYRVYVRKFGSVPTTDFEILPPDVVATDTIYKTSVELQIDTLYTEEQYVTTTFSVNNIIATSGTAIDHPILQSNDIETCTVTYTGNYYSVYIRYDGNVIPSGNRYSTIWLTVYSRTPISINGDFTVSIGTRNNISQADSSSNQVATQSDQVHTQEQNYFSQNSQAISNTGLSNYRFDTSSGNGVASVSNDFTSVFNALGGWNTIYIFSLTLGVALTILRHSPNAISRKLRQKQSE